jgi:glycosyltransferase involved in cell wall biosynthesis
MHTHQAITVQWANILVDSKVEVFDLSQAKSWNLLQRRIRSHKVHHVLVLDADATPPADLLRLTQIVPENIPIGIFVFLNLLFNLEHWSCLNALMKDREVRWLCGSDLVRTLAQQTVVAENSCQTVQPSINSYFCFSPATRNRSRGELGIRSDETLILCSGRLVFGKNPHLFLKWMLPILRENPKLRIHIAGAVAFDNPRLWINESLTPLYYFGILDDCLSKESLDVRKRVTWGLAKDAKAMAGLYQAADLVCSLSTFELEDLGLVPREALCCGAPVVISDWGGYQDLQIHTDVRTVRTSVHRGDVWLHRGDFIRAIRDFRRQTPRARAFKAEFYQKLFGIEPSLRRLQQSLKTSVTPAAGLKPFSDRKRKILKAFCSPMPQRPKGAWFNVTKDWLRIYKGSRKVLSQIRSTPAFEGWHFPFAQPYHSKVGSFFAEQAKSPQKRLPGSVVRSGSLEAENLKHRRSDFRQLYLHYELKPSHPSYGYYHVVSTHREPIDHLLAFGPDFIFEPWSSLGKTTLRLFARIEKIHPQSVVLWNPHPGDLKAERRFKKLGKILQNRFRHKQLEIRWVHRLEEFNHLLGYEVFEFNSRTRVADDFCLHKALSMGAQMPEIRSSSKLARPMVQLSPFHGLSFVGGRGRAHAR